MQLGEQDMKKAIGWLKEPNADLVLLVRLKPSFKKTGIALPYQGQFLPVYTDQGAAK